MNFSIKTIPHKKQRYETCGDWIIKNGKLKSIFVSDTKDEDYAFLIGIHEAIEAWLCLKNGVSQKEVDAFDKAFEKKRKKGNTDEPGNDPKAPYGKYHKFATSIEMQLATALSVDWARYEEVVNSL